MEVDFAVQTVTFGLALAVGAALSLVYDAFRILRLILRSRPLGIFVQDLLYSFLAAFVTYVLLLVRCEGELRGYPLLGELCGFLLCRLTLSALIWSVSGRIVSAVRRFKRFLKNRIFRPLLRKAAAALALVKKRAGEWFARLRKSRFFSKKAKKDLQGPEEPVYNQTVHGKKRAARRKRARPARKKGESAGRDRKP